MARAVDSTAQEWVVAPSDRKLPKEAPDRTEWLISHPTPREMAIAQDDGAEYLSSGSVKVKQGTLNLWAIRHHLHGVRKFLGRDDAPVQIEFDSREVTPGKQIVADKFIGLMSLAMRAEVAGMILGDVPKEADAEKSRSQPDESSTQE